MHLGDLYVKILMFYPEFKLIHMDYVLAVICYMILSRSMMGSEMGLHVLWNRGLHLCMLIALTWAFPVLFLDLECSPVSTSYMMPLVPIFHVSDLLLRLICAYVYSLPLPLCGFLGLIFSAVVMSLVSSINQAILSVLSLLQSQKQIQHWSWAEYHRYLFTEALSSFPIWLPTTQCNILTCKYSANVKTQ